MTRILLTTIVLLTTSQSLFAEEGKSIIHNGTSLVNRDWASISTTTYKIDTRRSQQYASNRTSNPFSRRYRTNYRAPATQTYQSTTSTILSLKPGDSWSKGKAWLLKVTKNGSNKNQTTYKAWKGFYTFYGDGDDEDNLILKVGFVRKYSGEQNRGRISWSFDSHYEKQGARIDIPLDDQTVPSKRISLSVVKGFFVDSKGNQTIKRSEPYGILERISGKGSIEELYSIDFWSKGSTVELNDSSAATILSSTGLGKSPPTGCRLHGRVFSK